MAPIRAGRSTLLGGIQTPRMMACVAIAVAVLVAGGPGLLVAPSSTRLTDTTGAGGFFANHLPLLINSGDSVHALNRQAFRRTAASVSAVPSTSEAT